jgi:hypothetical protein
MDNDDDVSFDYTPYIMVRNFVMKNLFTVGFVAILLVASLVYFCILVLPNVTYRASGTITRIDNAGLTVKISSVDADADVSMVGTEMMVGSGICALQTWSALCFIGAPVEVTFQGNRIGQEGWSVTALVRGFGGNDSYVLEKTEE